MIVLGIETSCDETAASVLDDGKVRSNVISSQMIHREYGGVVPELASRAHLRLIQHVVEKALTEAGITRSQLQGIAATYGPGLAGALLVGLSFAKGLAYGLEIPLVGVNHLEGHLHSNFLGDVRPDFPFLALIVSGGHSILATVKGPFSYTVLGQTRDDASGEAFDKVAKMLGLSYPGGPVIDRLAVDGNASAISFPRSFLEEGTYDFSFSGLKTSVLYYLRDENLSSPSRRGENIAQDRLSDICASFQEAVTDVLVSKTIGAAEEFELERITLAGGVSANSRLRKRMREEAESRDIKLFYPSLEYCMDNGAMIAHAGWMRLREGISSGLDLNVAPNLTL